MILTCGLCVCLSAAWICCSRSSVWLWRMACSSSTCWVMTFRRSGCSWVSRERTCTTDTQDTRVNICFRWPPECVYCYRIRGNNTKTCLACYEKSVNKTGNISSRHLPPLFAFHYRLNFMFVCTAYYAPLS